MEVFVVIVVVGILALCWFQVGKSREGRNGFQGGHYRRRNRR